MLRARIFIDFWNFQLAWNRLSHQDRCDWQRLPPALLGQARVVLQAAGVETELSLEETIVHASVDPLGEARLRGWLTNWLDHRPSFDVKIRDRRARRKDIHCRQCGTTTRHCPNCGEEYMGRPEKGVDAAVVTDLLSLAWQGAYDLAVLVTSDADYIPAVEHVQAKGLKVVNAGWRDRGHELQGACWGSFHIDAIQEELCR